MHQASVLTVPIAGPGDTAPIAALFDAGIVAAGDIRGVIAQTEGDGHARGFFAMSLELLLAERLAVARDAVAATIPILVIGGTAGLMTPHVTLFCRRDVPDTTVPRLPRALALGTAFTRPLAPDELGSAAQIMLVADAVRAAMADAGIADAADVAGVELKCPQPAGGGLQDPGIVGARSRGASALGAALALGEIPADAVGDAIVGARPDLHSLRASASSGAELQNVRVVVIGNRAGAPGSYCAGSGVMRDQLDVAGAHRAFAGAGLALADGTLADGETAKLAAVFVNAGADYAADCRGFRHTMKTDFLAGYSGHIAKAVAHATVATIARTPLLLGNAGAEHQGPPGSNLVCVVARHGDAG